MLLLWCKSASCWKKWRKTGKWKMQCPLLPPGPNICLWTLYAASSPNMKHVQGLIWFSSDGLPEHWAIGTGRQACITSLTAHRPPPLPKQLDSCWYGWQFPVRLCTHALWLSAKQGPHAQACFYRDLPAAISVMEDFQCCSSSTGLLCTRAAPSHRYLSWSQHPHHPLVSRALVFMPAYHHHPLTNYQHASEVISRNGWDDVKRRRCDRSQSKGGRHGCLHHLSAFKHRGATARSPACGCKYQQSRASLWRASAHVISF